MAETQKPARIRGERRQIHGGAQQSPAPPARNLKNSGGNEIHYLFSSACLAASVSSYFLSISIQGRQNAKQLNTTTAQYHCTMGKHPALECGNFHEWGGSQTQSTLF